MHQRLALFFQSCFCSLLRKLAFPSLSFQVTPVNSQDVIMRRSKERSTSSAGKTVSRLWGCGCGKRCILVRRRRQEIEERGERAREVTILRIHMTFSAEHQVPLVVLVGPVVLIPQTFASRLESSFQWSISQPVSAPHVRKRNRHRRQGSIQSEPKMPRITPRGLRRSDSVSNRSNERMVERKRQKYHE